MPLFRESQYLMHSFIILLLCWLGWLCGLALGQVNEAFTGSANISNIQITCIGNLAALLKLLLQGSFGPEYSLSGKLIRPMSYWPFRGQISEAFTGSANISNIQITCIGNLAALLKLLLQGSFGPEYSLSGKLIRPMSYWPFRGLSTCGEEELRNCSIVILSKQKTPSYWMRRFLEYISDDSDVLYIFLQYRPLRLSAIPIEICSDTCTENHEGRCGCIVFDTVEAITTKLARQIPGTVKRLSDSLCLLPSLRCLQNGCHGCNRGLLHVENDIFREGDSQVESPAAVCELLDCKSIHKEEDTFICIPVRSANEDEWTNRLIEFFKPDNNEFRGAVIRKGKTNASSALQNYKNGNGECDAVEKYKLASLYALPLLAIPLINLVLTFWLKVDAISSIVLAIQAVKGFISSKTYFFSPYRFLERACVKSNANKTNICQVLFFRSGGLECAYGCLVVCLCSVCCVSWMFLVALEGGPYNKWFHTHSMPPSTPRILVILLGICIALVMDAIDLKLYLKIIRRMPRLKEGKYYRVNISLICSAIVLQILSIVACSTIVGVMGIQPVGRWIYSALHGLALIKLGVASTLLVLVQQDLLSHDSDGEPNWWYGSCGLYICSSGFLLNAILAGVRAKWEF